MPFIWLNMTYMSVYMHLFGKFGFGYNFFLIYTKTIYEFNLIWLIDCNTLIVNYILLVILLLII